jgi:DNA mismatch endonuclease (patch repair protein)
MKANRKTGTRPEARIRSLLHRQGYRFRKNSLVQTAGLRVHPDIIFTRRKLAIFIDGCFWHCCPDHGTQPRANSSYWSPKLARNIERDGQVSRGLRDVGWNVLRIWEHEPAEHAVELIVGALESKKTNGAPLLRAHLVAGLVVRNRPG